MTNVDSDADGPAVLVSHAVGAAGEHLVGLRFTQLKWGIVENKREDVGHGIDVFIDVRRPSDRPATVISEGWMVAQVKAGPSQFRELSEGGWWFRIDATDRDNWLNRPLAHVLVIVDLESEVAYWAELTPSTVIAAGSNYKVFVPEDQTISPASAEALRMVHRRALVRAHGYRGTAWIRPGEATMAPGDALLAAILVPRLAAPHPNLVLEAPVTGVQAVALVCAGRLGDAELNREVFAARGVTTSAETWSDHPDWEWRLAAALTNLGHAESNDLLRKLVLEARTAVERAASLIASACSLARSGELVAATELLEHHRELFTDFLGAWIDVHLARLARRLGQFDTATELLAAALPHLAMDQEPWRTPVLIALRNAQLNLGSLGTDEFARAVQSADSAPSWWNAQARAIALEAHVDSMFATFAPQGSVRFEREDVAQNRLAGAILSSDLAGDQGRFMQESKLAAKRMALANDSDPETLARATEILRECGDQQGAGYLANRVLRAGGYEELAAMWPGVESPSWWQRSTAAASASVMKAMLTVLPQPEVDEFATALADAWDTRSSFHEVDQHTFMSLLAATVGPGGNASSIRALDALMAMHSDGVAQSAVFLRRAIDQLADDLVRMKVQELDALALHRDTVVARSAEARLAGLGHGSALLRIEERADSGDIESVAALLDLRPDDYEPSDGALAGVARALDDAFARARAGVRPGAPWIFGLGVHLAARSGRLNLWHTVLGGLTDPEVTADEKTAVALALLRLDASMLTAVHGDLGELREQICLGPHWDPTEREGSVEALTLAVGEVLNPDTNAPAAASACMAAPEPLAREIGIAIALRRGRITGDRRSAVLALQGLLTDEDDLVQRAAIQGIVDIACHDDEQAAWLRHMLRTLKPRATRVAATRIARHAGGPDGRRARQLLDSLLPNRDPFVERVAQSLLSEERDDSPSP